MEVLGEQVHPRGGGEHRDHAVKALHPIGSSPRGRGTPILQVKLGDAVRFIPAGAGNTLSVVLHARKHSVHPRGGGEHSRRPDLPEGVSGSSPRGRGTRHFAGFRIVVVRFIPAGAGNTRRATIPRWTRAVHPRGGGEHGRWYRPSAPRCGSSPRGRGTHERRRRARVGRRFIPAGAGNTSGE